MVCSRPDAEPACSGSTPPSTVAVIGMKTKPVDRPAIRTGPKTVPKYDDDVPSWLSQR